MPVLLAAFRGYLRIAIYGYPCFTLNSRCRRTSTLGFSRGCCEDPGLPGPTKPNDVQPETLAGKTGTIPATAPVYLNNRAGQPWNKMEAIEELKREMGLEPAAERLPQYGPFR